MKNSVGSRITSRLQGLVDTLKNHDGPVNELITGRSMKLDLACRTFDAQLVHSTREKLGASQAIFAQFLGVSLNTVRSWEQGAKQPNPMACRFMDEILLNPGYWRGRLADSARPKAGKSV